MNYYVCDVHGLELGVRCSGDVVELDKLFDGGKYSRDQVLWMVCLILDDVLVMEELVGHQLTVVVLEVSENILNGVVDRVCHEIADIHEIKLLDRGDDLLHEGLLDSRHFQKICTSLVCAIRMFEFACVVVLSRTMIGPGRVG